MLSSVENHISSDVWALHLPRHPIPKADRPISSNMSSIAEKMKYICPQITRSSSGNRWSVWHVECFLPEFLLRILTCVSAEWLELHSLIFVTFPFFIFTVWAFVALSLHFHGTLIGEFFSPYIFDIFFAQFFNPPYILPCVFPKFVKVNEVIFFASGEYHE